jgi:glutathione S-transferase
MPDLTIHHMLGSRSERVVWLAEELGIPYKVVLHMPNTKSGKVTSTLTDHVKDGKAPSAFLDGELLKESGYIVERLVRAFPSANIEATPSLDSIYWAHFAEGRIMTQCGAAMLNMVALPAVSRDMSEAEKKGAQAYSAHLAKSYKAEGEKALAEADAFLQKHQWFSGGDKPGIGDVSGAAGSRAGPAV